MYSILSLVTFLSNDIRYLELSRAAALSGYSLLSQLLYLKEAIINVVLQVKSSLSPESITVYTVNIFVSVFREFKVRS